MAVSGFSWGAVGLSLGLGAGGDGRGAGGIAEWEARAGGGIGGGGIGGAGGGGRYGGRVWRVLFAISSNAL